MRHPLHPRHAPLCESIHTFSTGYFSVVKIYEVLTDRVPFGIEWRILTEEKILTALCNTELSEYGIKMTARVHSNLIAMKYSNIRNPPVVGVDILILFFSYEAKIY